MDIETSEEDNIKPHQKSNPRSSKKYAKGTLKKIYLKNFMTYTEATIYPSPKLNVIIGPNGTGKSSIVCAICLGLAGKPKLLGRQGELREFIKRGADAAVIEITISGGHMRKERTIERMMKMNGTVSLWKIDGLKTTITQVKELIDEMKIQIDNLLQFMPQDKVAEFSSLNSIQLLQETQRTIGQMDLLEMHQRLTNFGNEKTTLEGEIENEQKGVEKAKMKLKDMERDVERINTKNALLSEVEIIGAKIEYKKIEEIEGNIKNTELMIKDVKKDMDMAKEEQREAERPLKKLEDEWKKDNIIIREQLELTKRLESELDVHTKEIPELREKYQEAMAAVQNLKQRSKMRTDKIKELKELEIKIKEEIRDCPKLPEADSGRMKELKERIKVTELTHNQDIADMPLLATNIVKLEKVKNQCEKEIIKINNIPIQRVKALEAYFSNYEGLYRSYEYIKTHKNEFKGRVYGPIISEISVSEPIYRKYVEQHVPRHVWSYFVVENKEDQYKLRNMGLMRQLNVAFYTGEADKSSNDTFMRDDYERFGIIGTLDEVIEAPLLVKYVLRDECSTHKSYYGSSETESKVDEFVKYAKTPVVMIWTPRKAYKIVKSRYANLTSKLVFKCQPVKLLADNQNIEEKNDLKRKLQEIQKEMDRLIGENERKKEISEKRLEELKMMGEEFQVLKTKNHQLQKKRSELMHKMMINERKLKEAEKQEDPMEKQPEIESKAKIIQDAIIRHTEATIEIFNKLVNMLEERQILQLENKQRSINIEKMKEKVHSNSNSIQVLQTKYDTLVRSLRFEEDELRIKVDALQRQYLKLEEMKENEFHKYPEIVEDLERQMKELEQKASAIYCNNPNVLNEYHAAQMELRKKENTLSDKTKRLNNIMSQMEYDKKNWTIMIKDKINIINEEFSKDFSLVGTEGKVVLVYDEEDEYNFEEYALEIRVKFRPEANLIVLDHIHQSGGERAVSTMLFLISLQSVTDTPLRVVDEINQGMDEENERKIFELLASTSAKKDSPQCFLLTPKLLPNLKCLEKATIHVIFNGHDNIDEGNEESLKVFNRKLFGVE